MFVALGASKGFDVFALCALGDILEGHFLLVNPLAAYGAVDFDCTLVVHSIFSFHFPIEINKSIS
jgi:hypothetical protein